MSDKEPGKKNEDKSHKAQQDSENEQGIVKNADMSEEIQSDALLIVTDALEKFKPEIDPNAFITWNSLQYLCVLTHFQAAY